MADGSSKRGINKAQEQALHQQALHQQALHHQSLQHHGLISSSSSTSKQQQYNPGVKSEPPEQHHQDFSKQICCVEAKDGAAADNSGDEKVEESEEGSIVRGSSGVFADLNVEPPTSDGEEEGEARPEEKRRRRRVLKEDSPADEEGKKSGKTFKSRSKSKWSESGVDGDLEYPGNVQNVKEEKIKSLKAGLVHVSRKLPKNAHAHFVLGLMYQRSDQPLKAIPAFERAQEILKQADDDLCRQGRAQLLALVQNHHAQCLLQGKIGGQISPGKDFSKENMRLIGSKVKEAVPEDSGQASIWNTLGLLLLHTGRIQSAISVFTSLLSILPDSLDALANLGVAYFQSGELDNAARCLQSVLEKDVYHPGALINYGAILVRQHGSFLPGAGAGASKETGAYATQLKAAHAACLYLQTSLKEDPKAGSAWVNLAAAYEVLGDFTNASKCLEQASRLEPHRLATRYAVAAHRIKDAERSDDPSEQMSWAANEMASILREGDPGTFHPHLAWAGLAMVNRAQHESAASFDRGVMDSKDVEERAVHTLQQAIEEDPEDALKWHQLGLHTLCTLQFVAAQSYLKSAIARRRTFAMAWSNLGIALHLSDDPSLSEAVYKRALSLMPENQSYGLHSNLGNLYRQQKKFAEAHESFDRALRICPNYAPACNNLGLLYVAEGKWVEAIEMFDQAFLSDPYLDVAKSNKIKATALYTDKQF
ncbi:hypothetical protein SELMODRAFT_438952 [Selaginella moellendorffii]|uniref:UDP-N-acetylglucosamine--peptide N-acetylglucosaminyltransferase SPINDLY n=1 Tax=Selaginella moellendorffii TaxID=88036 RepID=D8R0P5_SELML|nr:probable UDP-N-acetylglucosamine--peptide N-acetylglucosaminyltransferase SPINDLY [Selaginella moellendorffii]XP_002966801.1 probable UDP-N-acetylglucosamine--peptide N-acetylglucosaminyltransferase SPINDLY [Selaginella moellendorffii]EFJ32828.1 hypothetical protein SELMODRAFT_439727 [Selaginella moellendorffii]EFJ34617.1 hypothetical protein SELMODRAFT_438952 [Selaginella moellendorffii]|eukprot:XP_002964284.1 probable UDP-N-acetylglucosamine--peptide N-acetylglucosaminyltransferase SPINDLY [Selaginella moellendorffii]